MPDRARRTEREFFSTADFVERGRIYLERAGLNKDGALYKVYANLLNKDAGNTATSGVEKKTRKFENNNDLKALIDGLDLTGPALANYLYDNIDIPRCVNMLAVNSVIRNIDMTAKLVYLPRYRAERRWAILPWDLDLAWSRWNTQNTYFDNASIQTASWSPVIPSGWWPTCSQTLPFAV